MSRMERSKGVRGEQWLAKELRPLFPQVQRNMSAQSQSGGRDLVNTNGFDFEVKYGKTYTSKMVRDVINQLREQSREGAIRIAVIRPHREEAYGVVPMPDLLALLKQCHLSQGKVI